MRCLAVGLCQLLPVAKGAVWGREGGKKGGVRVSAALWWPAASSFLQEGKRVSVQGSEAEAGMAPVVGSSLSSGFRRTQIEPLAPSGRAAPSILAPPALTNTLTLPPS